MNTINNWLANEFHAWLAGVISWEEKALAILNGPALKYSAFAAAFVMRIPALSGIPGVDIAYSCLVLLGVDVQYIACVRQAAESTGRARWLWGAVSVVLAIPVLQTNAVFTLHSQTGIPELAAMGMIHLTPAIWAIECAVLLVLLMAVSALSRPSAHPVPVAPVAAPTAPPTRPPLPPTTPEKPTSKRTPRRDTGRTVEETEALKRRAAPAVLALAADGQPHREIARRLNLTQFMVSQILKDGKREKGAA